MFKKLNDPKTGAKAPDVQKPGKSLVDMQSPPMLLDILSQANRFTEDNGVETMQGEVEVEVVLYAKGMTIDKSVFREYASADGQRAMEEIVQGRVPQELLIKSKGSPISLIICDRRTEEFVAERLDKAGHGPSGKVDLNYDFKYDESEPTTTLQIRFHNDHDVKKIMVNMNTKVADLHEFIMQCAPVDEEYVLMCGYPPKPLEEPNVTVEMLHLLNGTVIQQVIL